MAGRYVIEAGSPRPDVRLPVSDTWYDSGFDDHWTVTMLLDWGSQRYAQRDALWMEGQGWLTHGQLRSRATRVRGALLSDIPPNTRTIATLTRVAAPWYVGIQAVMTCGLAYTALDPEAPDERNLMCMEDCDAMVILAEASLKEQAQRLAQGKRRVVIVEDVQETGPEVPVVQADPESAAAYIFTSGSTGRPKAVVRSHRSLAHAMYCLAENYSDVPSDTLLSPGSPGYVGTLNDALEGMITGFRTVAIDVTGVDMTRMKELMTEQHVTVMALAPSLLRVFLREIKQEKRTHFLRSVIGSGEPLLRSDVALFHETLPGVELWQNYGSTETGPMASGRYSAEDANGQGPLPLQRKHKDCELELIGEDGQPVAVGQSGAVRVRTSYLSTGYLNATPEQQARFGEDHQGRFFLIGDHGYRTANGDLYITGRGDRQIKMHGRRMELGDVESVIRANPLWSEAVVVQIPGNVGNSATTLVAIVQPADPDKADLLQLREYLSSQLPPAAIPRRFVVVPEIPRTTSGKVDLATITQLATRTAEVAAIGRGGPPQSTMEKWIADTWQFILKIDRPGREDRFQDLGGDSMAAIDFSLALEKQFGVCLSLDKIVQKQTIAELVAELENGTASKRQAIVNLRSDGAGPVCVMFPGEGGHAWTFSSLVHAMAGPCDVLALSLIDLLESNHESAKIRDLVRIEIQNALEPFDKQRPIVLAGYSFGAMIAADTAAWLLQQGLHVRHILLLDPSPIDSTPTSKISLDELQYAKQVLVGRVTRVTKRLLRGQGIRPNRSPAAMQLEAAVIAVSQALDKAYCDGTVLLPQIPTSWLASREKADKYKRAKKIYGRPRETIEQQILAVEHFDFLRPPWVNQTIKWIDEQLEKLGK